MNPTFVAVIKSLILPPGIFVLLIFFILVVFRDLKTIKSYLFFIVIVVFYLISTPFIARHLAGIIEPEKALNLSIKSDAQAIVILGCNVYVNAPEYAGKDDVSSCTLVRLRYAAEVYSKINLPVMTCGGSVFNKSEAEADVMARVLKEHFNVITKWKERESINTYQNVENAVAILKKEHINNIILVTHAIHMKRASYSFEKNNIKVSIAPTYFFSAKSNNSVLLDFMPDIHSFYVSRFVAYETIGLIWHWLKHF
jgi:uncharacterized SAM-binding protein YcdF (DUF218 family)